MSLTLSRKFVTTSIFGMASLFIGACGQDMATSDIKVTNGMRITEDLFPAAVLLVSLTDEGQGICTGTFVNDYQVVTAAHCVIDFSEENPPLYYVELDADGKEAVAVSRARTYVANPNYSLFRNGGVNGSDLAVLDFARNTAPATASIASRSPAVGDDLTIVGYGNNHNFFGPDGRLTGSGSGEKRTGTNVISSKSNGFINFNGLPGSGYGVELGELVGSGSGDSGGPMFVDGELVGVTSGGGLSRTRSGLVSVSRYVDLNSRESRNFLNRVLDGE
ncbi:MAG: trypsin-like serine protease [Oligoflexus sp.]